MSENQTGHLDKHIKLEYRSRSYIPRLYTYLELYTKIHFCLYYNS